MSEKTEEELTVWIKEQIDAYDAGTIDPDLLAHLDAEIPGWNDAGARARVTPEPDIADTEAMESWLAVNREAHALGVLPEGRAAYLDSIVPGWADAVETAAGEPAAAEAAAPDADVPGDTDDEAPRTDV